MGKIYVCACYLSPNIRFSEYRALASEIALSTTTMRGNLIIAGDLNAKSLLWNSPPTDRKGLLWEEIIGEGDWLVCNTGTTPTFTRGRSTSFIDVTMASSNLSRKVKQWKVLDRESLSHHAYITFEEETKMAREPRPTFLKVIHDWDGFEGVIGPRIDLLPPGDTRSHKRCTQILCQEVQNAAIRSGTRRMQPYWWNVEIRDLRDKATRLREPYSRPGRRLTGGENT